MEHDRGHDVGRDMLRSLPSVNEVVEAARARPEAASVPRAMIVESARAALDRARAAMLSGRNDAADLLELAREADHDAALANAPRLSPAINATGVILHTGLGRSPWCAAAVEAAAAAVAGAVPIELDLDSGARGRRSSVVRGLLTRLTGAESATVVNNNAAAMTLTLAALAPGLEVVVSRGELVEIGGSFRLPEVIETGGALLREVGTTNKTRAHDYEHAIGDRTGAILRVHTSNFRVEGFTHAPTVAELAAIAHEHGVPFVHDVGSGLLAPGAIAGVPADEPDVRSSIDAGADVVMFSGDKLLGGPQAGVIVGRSELIERIERHPLMRAVRVGKATLAGLEATLRVHLDPARARRDIPALAMMGEPIDAVRARAADLCARLGTIGGVRSAVVRDSVAHPGGGSAPAEAIRSAAVVVTAAGVGEGELARRLRTGQPCVVARVADGAVWFDARTIRSDQIERVAEAVVHAVDAGDEAEKDE